MKIFNKKYLKIKIHMKKLLTLVLVLSLMTFMSCGGPSAGEIENVKNDSIVKADSIALIVTDSIAKADSIAKVPVKKK